MNKKFLIPVVDIIFSDVDGNEIKFKKQVFIDKNGKKFIYAGFDYDSRILGNERDRIYLDGIGGLIGSN